MLKLRYVSLLLNFYVYSEHLYCHFISFFASCFVFCWRLKILFTFCIYFLWINMDGWMDGWMDILCVFQKPSISCSGKMHSFLEAHCPVFSEKFWPTVWCIEARAQTIIYSVFGKRPPVPYEKYVFSTNKHKNINVINNFWHKFCWSNNTLHELCL